MALPCFIEALPRAGLVLSWRTPSSLFCSLLLLSGLGGLEVPVAALAGVVGFLAAGFRSYGNNY